MSLGNLKKAFAALASAAFLLSSGGNVVADDLNLRRGVTTISQQAYDLHMLVLWICIIAGVVVFSVMFYSIFKHRKSKGAVAAPFHENTTIEVLWTIVPFAILVLIAIPATKTLLELEDSSDADMSIKVTGYQWKWKYDYLDEDISFFSALDAKSNEARQRGSGIDPASVEHYLLNVDNPIVVPTNKKIRFLITANDVLHAWWVPDLGFKRDAIPGYINEAWAFIETPGVYRGQCAELCGKDHGFMPIVVVAKEEGEYRQWVAQMQAEKAAADAASGKTYSMAALMKTGEEKYNTACASCHMANGAGIPNVFPALKDSKIAIGPIAEHLSVVIHGSKTNPAMAAFGPQLNDLDLAAIITYERNAWGNDTGDLVQPADIAAAR